MSSGGTSSNGWNIAEDNDFERAVAQLGGAKWVDDALDPIIYSLYRNPLGFPKVPGYRSLYLAKTALRIRGAEIIPSLRLWFAVDEQAREVTLLWVEIAPADDMGFTTDMWGDPWDDTDYS